jgi:hypothetical protein
LLMLFVRDLMTGSPYNLIILFFIFSVTPCTSERKI